jgi:hypothetical protein
VCHEAEEEKRERMNGDWNRDKEEKVIAAVNITVAAAGVVTVVVVKRK